MFFVYLDLFPYVESANPVTEQFLNEIVKKGIKYITENNTRETKVVNFKTPDELMKLIDFEVGENPEKLGTILNEIDNILKYVVRTGKKYNSGLCSVNIIIYNLIFSYLFSKQL